MLKENKTIFSRCNIDKWHDKGFLGQGVRIAVLDVERDLYKYQDGFIQRPLGSSGRAGGHLGQCCSVLEQVAPNAEIFALPKSVGAWEWVLQNNIDIVSCSYSAGRLPLDLEKRLEASNIIVCASAGNSYNKKDGADGQYPSAYSWTVSVGAYCPNLEKVEAYSNGGRALDCVAFTDIAVQTDKKGTTMEFGGTSAACPLAAGMLALVLNSERNGCQWAKEFVREFSEDILEKGKDLASGYGLFILPETGEVEEMLEIRMKLDDRTAYVNGQQVELTRPPQEENGVTLVPLRFVAESLGCQVDYLGNETREIIIKK